MPYSRSGSWQRKSSGYRHSNASAPPPRTCERPRPSLETHSPSGTATFGVACRGCPLRERCTTARGGRALHIFEHDPLLRAARRYADADAFQQPYRQQRPMVERSIAWLVQCPSRPLRTTPRPLILRACENEAIGFHQAVDQSRGGW